jgi:hypothetical protein
MADMTLSGDIDKPKGMLIPILIALAVLAAVGVWFGRTYLRSSVAASVDHVETYPVHVKYARTGGMLVGADQTEDDLYVITDIVLKDPSEVPLFVSSIKGTVTLQSGEVMEANVIDKNDLERLMKMFPALQPLTAAAGTPPLTRESQVAAGATGRGYAVMSYNIPQSEWDKRQAADVTVQFLHQDAVTIKLPK